MAEFKFEGDISNISERQLQFINKVILEQNLKIKRVIFHSFAQAGDNFMSDVKRISLEGENGSMKVIAKIAPIDESVRASSYTEYLFKVEHIMYTEILPKLVSLQKAAKVPEEEHLRFAKCYGSLDEAPNEVIILEDLKESGYFMLDKFEPLQDNNIKSVLKTLAIFHSLSHVLRNKEPATYDLYKNMLPDMTNISPEELKNSFKSLDDFVATIIENEAHRKILKNKISNTLDIAPKLAKEEDPKYLVIQHGDVWVNNILFKQEDGAAVRSILIDYQVAKTNNPSVDLLYLIFNCTDHESRSKHFYNWLDYYHFESNKSLAYFGLKADLIYPRNQVDADIKRYSEYIFGSVLLNINMTDRDRSETGEMIESLENGGLDEIIALMGKTKMNESTLKHVRNKIEGLINSYVEFGFLEHFNTIE
ncbi:uncharacterized protein LOC111354259 [Spodoptera litura]|uniref:Uncharacterized protein LOC111354259 n=1 Tax=Spodoptera litura TaxID=69820 RepID=A0A9J7ISD3_SPOLT|nr:uncharacterized protein LOC111354259 [Spodoptera litura]